MNLPAIIEEVQSRLDIVDVVSRYVALKPSGRRYKGLCPFHSEKTPSFTVSPDKKLWHCFGCGAGGNLFTFLMKIEHLTFMEALRELATQAGVSLKDLEREDPARQRFLKLHQLAQEFYSHTLLKTERGQRVVNEYLIPRGVLPNSITTFELGLAPDVPDAFSKWAVKKAFQEKEILDAGLAISRPDGLLDRFRNRLIFPIKDISGRTVGFAGRALVPGDEPKYVNSPQTSLFDKGKLLYGLHLAKDAISRAGAAVLTEGYMDVIGLFQAGVENAVASMGTSLTIEQIRLLHRFTSNVFLAYDADSAGEKASTRGISLFLEEGVMPRIIVLPSGQDPDDFIREKGLEAWQTLLSEAEPYVLFYLNFLKQTMNWDSPEGKRTLLTALFPVLHHLRDPLVLSGYLEKIANGLHLPLSRVEQEWSRISIESKTPRKPTEASPSKRLTEEMRFLGALLQDPERATELKQILAVEDLQDERVRKIYSLCLSSEPITFPLLTAALSEDESASQLLSQIVTSSDIPSFSWQELLQLAKGLHVSALRYTKDTLQRHLQEAHKRGDTEEEKELAEKVADLNRRLSHLS